MSKAFELISDSLNEIIEDFEKNDGKNLKRETLTLEKKKIDAKKVYRSTKDFHAVFTGGAENVSV